MKSGSRGVASSGHLLLPPATSRCCFRQPQLQDEVRPHSPTAPRELFAASGNSATEPYIVSHNLLLTHGYAVARYVLDTQGDGGSSPGLDLLLLLCCYCSSSHTAAQRSRAGSAGKQKMGARTSRTKARSALKSGLRSSAHVRPAEATRAHSELPDSGIPPRLASRAR